MKTTRRNFIKIAGTSSILLAASNGLSSCSIPSEAIEAWNGPDSQEKDPRIRALSFAILAPNPHNMQPWIVDLSQKNEVILFCDLERLLPETDPFSRQIMIGHGCFLEHLNLAAKQGGYYTEINYFPNGKFTNKSVNKNPVAKIKFIKDAHLKPDPLFQQILKRHTNRDVYQAKEVATDQLAKLEQVLENEKIKLSTTNETYLLKKLRKMSFEGHKAELYAPNKWQESIDVSRIGANEILEHRDGLSFGGTFFEMLKFFGIMTKESLADTGSMAFESGLTEFEARANSAMAFAWLTTQNNDRITQLQTGRAYARMQLKLTELGMVLHPWSQVLQEYEEVQHLQKQFLDLVKTPQDHTVQMFVRLGYATPSNPAPRRKLRDLFLS